MIVGIAVIDQVTQKGSGSELTTTVEPEERYLVALLELLN